MLRIIIIELLERIEKEEDLKIIYAFIKGFIETPKNLV